MTSNSTKVLSTWDLELPRNLKDVLLTRIAGVNAPDEMKEKSFGHNALGLG